MGAATLIAACLAPLCLAPLCLASSATADVRRDPPIMVSAAAPNRQALIVAPVNSRVAADAEAYRNLLRRLGFEVETLAAESRVDLDAELRRYPASVHGGAEVLVLVLGTTLARDGDLFVTAMPPAADVVAQPSLYAAEGVRLTDALRRIAARDLAAIVDFCRAADGKSCARATASLGEGISAIVATRAAAGTPSDMPLAGIASLRNDLIPLMEEPGLSLLDAYGRLRERLKGTDMALAATPSLSRNFVFMPTDFLARLPTACNTVERGTDAATLRGRDLGALAGACANAARIWDFASWFSDKLTIVREQTSYLRAVVRCPADPAEAYLRDYPNGTYRGEVELFKTRCDDEAQAAAARDAAARAPAAQAAAAPVVAPVEAPRRVPAALVPREGQSASFSCDSPLREPVAQLICADAELAAADYGLGLAYRTAVRATLFPQDRHAVVSGQLAWLARRVAACGIPADGDWSLDDLARFKPCLLAEIDTRTRELAQ